MEPSLAFPPLPQGSRWPLPITEAYAILLQSYARAVHLLQLEDGQPVRLRLNAQTIKDQAIPLLRALESAMPNNLEWIAESTVKLMNIITDLELMAAELDVRSLTRVTQIRPVYISHTGRAGRPSKSIRSDWLEEAFAPHRLLSVSALANALGMHRHTLQKHLTLHGIQRKFCTITDGELDTLVQHVKEQKPNAGRRYIIGFFRKQGLKIQKRRVQSSMERMDAVGQALRTRRPIQRRQYEVPRPNSLWHLDGHHKLIRWGIVIHGIVDGYCRTIVGLQANTNNRASTVLELFLEAVRKYGSPKQARGDKGGENVDVSVWMILHEGPNRGSFLWGDSTRNSRMERTWVEIGTQVARRWKAFFSRLERLHFLDIDQAWNLWLLHYLFLDEINQDLKNLQDDWNNHPLSRFGHDKSPSDMRFLGELKYGRYTGRYSGRGDIHPGIATQYGHLGNDYDQIAEQVAITQERNIRHEAVKTPSRRSPFTTTEMEAVFGEALRDLDRLQNIPTGLGVAEEEWPDSHYPDSEVITVARKEFDISLPFRIWWPRAVRWARAFELIVKLQMEFPDA